MSLNDPQWGKRGPEGPPDLDELWRNFSRKLGAMFGRRGDSGSGEGGPGRNSLGGGIWILCALAIAIWVGSGFYIVDASQRGVVLRFGKYAETTEPGLRWHLPYPMESAEIVNLSGVRTVEVGYRNNVKKIGRAHV